MLAAAPLRAHLRRRGIKTNESENIFQLLLHRNRLSTRQRTLCRPRRGHRQSPSGPEPAFPSPSTAGRAMTSAASRTPAARLGGGLAVTGNYPGKARTPDELRADFEKALSLIPGRHRFNLHAMLRRDGRQEGGPRRARPSSSSRTGSPGRRHKNRPRFQPDLFRPSEGRRRLHAHASRQGHPQILDRARHPLPRNRRRHRQGARQDLRSPTSGFPTA